MRSSPIVASAALALCMVLLSFGSSALVEPKAEVTAATLAWGQTLGENDPEKVLPFYSEDAVLRGTLSPTVRSDRAALRDYFVTAFKVLPGLKVAFGDQLIRVYGNAAVNTGYYTFSYVKDGETKSLPARLQLHLCQERRALADRRPPFLGHAINPEIAHQVFEW
jgi:hypothetical protein